MTNDKFEIIHKLMNDLKLKQDKNTVDIDISRAVMNKVLEEKPSFFILPLFTRRVIIGLASGLLIILLLSIYGILYSPAKVKVTFTYIDPKAKIVNITGDFSQWEPKEMMQKQSQGRWTITLALPRHKRYKYVFIVNGNKFIPDPEAAEKIYDGFGGWNSVINTI